MSESTQATPEPEIVVTIYGWPFDYKRITDFARQHKIGHDEVIHLITTKLEWTAQFLIPNAERFQK
jgi:hypothetical protein